MPHLKMCRMEGHSLSVEEQDKVIELYNDLGELCDRQAETIERCVATMEALRDRMKGAAP